MGVVNRCSGNIANIIEDNHMAVFGILQEPVSVGFYDKFNMRCRKIKKVEFVVWRMDDDFVEIGNRIFILDYPDLPAFFVRGSTADAVEFFTGNLLKTG